MGKQQPSPQPDSDSTPSPEPQNVSCDTCGGSGPTGTLDIYDVVNDTWKSGVPCWNHNPRPH